MIDSGEDDVKNIEDDEENESGYEEEYDNMVSIWN